MRKPIGAVLVLAMLASGSLGLSAQRAEADGGIIVGALLGGLIVGAIASRPHDRRYAYDDDRRYYDAPPRYYGPAYGYSGYVAAPGVVYAGPRRTIRHRHWHTHRRW